MPSLLSDCDLDAALAAVAGLTDGDSPNVVYGTQPPVVGQLKRVPVQTPTVSGLERIGTSITLILRADALSGLVVDAVITVDGAAYVIRDPGTVQADGLRRLALVEQ